MFLVDDTVDRRHTRIKRFLTRQDAAIAVLLAAADFEWTVRRAIIALGTRPNTVIRNEVLSEAYGPGGYKDAWKVEVYPNVGKYLSDVIPNWEYFQKEAFPLRNKLIHGIEYAPMVKYASERVLPILAGSAALVQFSAEHGVDIYRTLPVRRKPRALK